VSAVGAAGIRILTMGCERKLLRKRIKTIDPFHPHPDIIEEAVGMILSGGVIMFPTRGLYGLGADANHHEAVEKVFQIKQRPLDKALLVLIGDRADLDDLVKYIPGSAENIMKRFWPGGVTIVFEAKETVSESLTAGTGKIGARMPEHPVALALSKAFGGPITGTSANLSGSPGCKKIDDIDFSVAKELDLILDAGPLSGGTGSTVVDVTVNPPVILRVGSVSEEEIFAALTA
jgi:L-threonylcarbamoyladenylate synthase